MSKGIGIKNNYKLGGSVKKMESGGMPIVEQRMKYIIAKANKGEDRLTQKDIDTAQKFSETINKIKSSSKYAGMGKQMKAMEAGINTKKYGGSMKKMKSGGLSAKQKKLARMAPPPDKITGADFKAMKSRKKKA